MNNLLSVDVEDWYHANALDIPISQWGTYESRVVGNTKRIIELFEKYEVKATFFVLGCVAEQHPGLIKEIVSHGHEVASHGRYHQLVYTLTEEQFREDVRKSKAILEDITGKQVSLYRAPSWSIKLDQLNRLTILQEEGYLGDSSLQPFWTPLSGNNKSPMEPFYPIVNGERLSLLEIPPTVINVAGLRLPFAGGFYLRFFPSFLVKQAMRLVNLQRKGLVYIHPWEFDVNMPRVEKSALVKFIHYNNIASTETKLEKMLQNFHFGPMNVCLEKTDYHSVRL
ncbi:MAG: polysaccharide deacetylase family protein [Bacillota bacterium]|nr:polysaccharide deacetylase family protein [Bacillota bacterium]